MTLQTSLDQADRNEWAVLRGNVAAGLHDLPEAFVTSYDQLLALAEQNPPADAKAAHNATSMEKFTADMALKDWQTKRDQQADRLFLRAVAGLQPYGETIEQHLAAALSKHLAAFAKDAATIGAHAGKALPDDAVVAATLDSRPFGQAWLRFTSTGAWYLPLRQSWAVLRRLDQGDQGDPLGVDSILAEVANAAELRPDDWRNLRAGSTGWPAAVHVRLAAILREGGRVWLPSARQQNEAYKPHMPDLTPHYLRPGGNRSPYAAVRGAAGRPLAG